MEFNPHKVLENLGAEFGISNRLKKSGKYLLRNGSVLNIQVVETSTGYYYLVKKLGTEQEARLTSIPALRTFVRDCETLDHEGYFS